MSSKESLSSTSTSPQADHHQQRIARVTSALLRMIYRAPYLTLILSLILTVFAAQAGYQLKNRLHTKIQDLLPDHAPSVIASRSLSERLDSVDVLVLTLMTDDFDQVKQVMPQLQKRLEQLAEVRSAQWRQNTELIQRNALITFPTLDELKEAYQDLREEIKRVVSERMNLFDDDADGDMSPTNKSLSVGQKFRRKFVEKFNAAEGKSYTWGELEGDEKLSDIGAQLRGLDADYPEHFHNSAYTTIGMKIFPTQPSNDLVFCQRVVEAVERESRAIIERELGKISADGVVRRLDLGGAYVGVLTQSKKIKGDMLSSTLTSFSLLALVLLVAFRSMRGLVCVLVPLTMGTIWTLGLTALTIGYLNLITVFIFAVLLGLGIDFGIHFYGRFREERARGAEAFEAMERAHLSCGHASLLAASTTSAAFLALTLADFRGLSQFGGVAAMGVMLCLTAVFIVMPAIVFIWERWSPLNLLGYQVTPLSDPSSGQRTSWVNRLGGRVAVVGLFIGVLGLALAPYIQLELNFNRLKSYPKPPEQLSAGEVSAKSLQYGTTKATSPTVVFASSPEEARSLQDQLRALADDATSGVKSVQSLYSLIPTEQSERIKWARKLCRKIKRKYKLFEGDPRAGAERLLKHCAPEPFTEADLPQWVTDQFTDRQGVVGGFLFVSPRGSASDGELALAFHQQMQTVKTLSGDPPMVAGRSMIWAEVLTAMKSDGALTFGVALILVLVLMGLLERSWIGLFFVSAPLILGLGFTVGMMVLLEIKLNFFNLLALPTLIGMGVDDGVHMHHRYRELGPGSASYIVKTTGRAAFLTTLTTSIGFASLMLTDHRGLNSLGLLSVIGMSSALFATLVILPALFNWWDRRRAQVWRPKSTSSVAMILIAILISLCWWGCEDEAPGYDTPGQRRARDAQVDPGSLTDKNITGGETQRVDAGSAGGPAGTQEAGEMSRGGSSSGDQAGGTSGESSCETPCDCPSGQACEAGRCVMGAEPVYCCSRLPCPSNAACVTRRGEEMRCPSLPCETACDCEPGLTCEDQECVISERGLSYCCEHPNCPIGRACEFSTGSAGLCEGEVQCTRTCDCLTGLICAAGRCDIPPADAPLLLCCERDCSALTSGVECESEAGAIGLCPE